MNLNEIKDFISKQELVEFFKAKGVKITDQEIENLKKAFASTKNQENALKMKQLSEVVGGAKMILAKRSNVPKLLPEGFIAYESKSEKDVDFILYYDGKKQLDMYDLTNMTSECLNTALAKLKNPDDKNDADPVPQPFATIRTLENLHYEFAHPENLQKDLNWALEHTKSTSVSKEELEFLETLIQEDKST